MSAKLMTDISVLIGKFEGLQNRAFTRLYNHAVAHGGAYVDYAGASACKAGEQAADAYVR